MPDDQVQLRVLAQAVCDIRQLLSGYLGSNAEGDVAVRVAAHLAYALHNEAGSVLQGKGFDVASALSKVRTLDAMFGEKLSEGFLNAASTKT